MFICARSAMRVHISVRVHSRVGCCVGSLFVCVRESVSVGAAQELKRPWDEYVEQM